MQTVLIAGGAGFIGSHLCEQLLKDYNILCVDNLITGSKDNISHLLKKNNFLYLEKDVTIFDQIDTIEKVDYIFHLASPASPNKKSKKSYINFPIETLEVNSIGTQNLLKLAIKHNAKFLFASTSETYGDPLISPQKEDYFGNVNPVGIRSVYDESKRFGEAITMAYFRKFNVDARIIRIFNTYGPQMQKDDGRVVSNFINQALSNHDMTIYGNGTQTRSFCFISDMVNGIQKALFTPHTTGEVINLGNPDERTVAELADTIRQLTNTQSQIIYEDLPEDDPKKRNPDITKARSLLEWNPSVTIEAGLNKTIEYFKSL